MMIRKTLLVFMLLLLVATMATAQDSVSVGQTVEGTLENSTATYTLNATAGDTIIISLTSEDFDTLVEVRDAQGNEVGRDDDSGEGFNSRLVFTAPAEGTYSIVVQSFSGAASGSYTLALESLETSSIGFDAPVEVSFSEEQTLAYFTFEGKAGEVVDIRGDSGGNFDSRLALQGPNGEEIATDDDSGASFDPYIHRQVLPADGQYVIALEPFTEGEVGTVSLSVTLTELISLDEGIQTATLGDELAYERLAFTAEAGTQYRVSVRTSDGSPASPTVEIGEDFGGTRANVSNVSEFSFVFTASSSEQLSLGIRGFDDVTYEISVQPAG